MNIRFVVFHTGVDTLGLYLPLMRVSQEALAVTNPGARYVVLTDRATAPKLEKEFEVEVLAPRAPLMVQYVEAQRAYERKAEPGLVVLAATDCVANRDLSTTLAHGVAVTYRNRGKNLINNIAYICDHDRAAWFLKRALDMMRPHEYHFWGDQQSWEDALGPSENWERLDDREEGLRVASPDGCEIYLYPCRSHNYFVKRSGAFSEAAKRAFLVHFKGTRKYNMVRSVRANILGHNVPGEWLKPTGNEPPLPMELRRLRLEGECGSSLSEIRDIGDKN
jgi:hypothetical protein